MPKDIMTLKSRRIVYHLFCFLNFMIFLIVILTPFWLWNNFNNDLIFMGLWLKCDNSGCYEMSLPNVSPGMLQTAQWFSLLAFISSLTSLILSQDNLIQFVQAALSKKLISTMAHFAAGIFLLLSLMITCFGITREINTEESYLSPSFGFYIGCIACLLDFLLAPIFKSVETFLYLKLPVSFLHPKQDVDKSFPLNFPKRIYRILSSINFVLLLMTTSSPLLLRFKVYHSSFLNGWWSVCDGYGCNSIVSSSGPLLAARLLSVAAVFSGFIALISAWRLLSRLIGQEVAENLISSLAHFGTGFFLLSALLITLFNLRIKIDIHNNKMKIYYGFYIGCSVCFLSFVLGIISLLYHKGLMKEKENMISDINAGAQKQMSYSDNDQPTV